MPAQASAQDASTGQIADIVVTATKSGASSVQKTPIAISAFSAEQLRSTVSVNVQDLAAYTPGLNIGSSKGGNAVVFIRGIGSSNYSAGADPDVTVNIDGVYVARQSGVFNDFLDVDRVEILRGPQGTLYGRNSVGGTINIISKQPSRTLKAEAQLTVGNYGLVEPSLYVTGPLADGVQFSVAGSYLRHDHYIQNINPAGNDLYNADHGALRAQLRVELGDNIVATTRGDWFHRSEDEVGYDTLLTPYPNATLSNSVIGNLLKTAIDTPQHTTVTNFGVSEEINIRLGAHVDLKSITAYREDRKHFTIDSDDTDLNYLGGFSSERERQFSQEINLLVHSSRFEGVVGAFYFNDADVQHTGQITRTTATGAPTPTVFFQVNPSTPTESFSAFAQGTFHLTDTFRITAGYRYSVDDKSITQNAVRYLVGPPQTNVAGFPFDAVLKRHFHGGTPKFGIDWQVTPTTLVYASATRGYKSGGFNYAATTVAALGYEPETVWSYEAGLKSDLFDHRLRINLAAFTYDYKNLQVQALLGAGVVSILNAATARGRGVEAEVTARPGKGWMLSGNLTVLDSTYNAFPNASVASGVKPLVLSSPRYNAALNSFDAQGNRLSFAPKFTANAIVQHDWDLGSGSLYVRGEYFYTSRTYYDPTNILEMSQAPYGLFNASIGFNTADNGWKFQAFIKNIGGRQYINGAQGNVVPTGIPGAPRTFGLRITRDF